MLSVQGKHSWELYSANSCGQILVQFWLKCGHCFVFELNAVLSVYRLLSKSRGQSSVNRPKDRYQLKLDTECYSKDSEVIIQIGKS